MLAIAFLVVESPFESRLLNLFAGVIFVCYFFLLFVCCFEQIKILHLNLPQPDFLFEAVEKSLFSLVKALACDPNSSCLTLPKGVRQAPNE